jgi:signal transduction histidine kinase
MPAAASKLERLTPNALLEIARALARAHTEDEIGRILTEQVFETIGATGAAAYILDHANNLRLVSWAGPLEPPRSLPIDVALPLPTCVRLGTALFLGTREQILQDYPLVADVIRLATWKSHACLCLPLRSGDQVLGGVVYGFEQARTFEPDEKAFFLTIKNHASLGLERGRLQRDGREARKRLEVIAHVSKRFSEAVEGLNNIAMIVADELSGALQGTCTIHLFSANRDRLDPTAVADVLPERLASIRQVFESAPVSVDQDSLVAQAARSAEPVIMTNVDADAFSARTTNVAYRAHLQRFPVQSLAIIPLRADGSVLGTLTVSVPPGAHPLSTDDSQMIVDLADRAALAIKSAQLHEEARRAVRAREDMIAVVSHDLRGPLMSFALGLQVLAQRSKQEAQAPKVVSSMHRAVERMTSLVDNLLNLAVIDAGTLRIEPDAVDVTALLDEMFAIHQPIASERAISLLLDVSEGVGSVRGARNYLTQALANLVSNAIKFTPAGGSVRLSVQPQDADVHFTVSDTGPGIDPDHLPHIFDRYWQASRRPAQGIGLGLAIAHGIVEAHAGSGLRANPEKALASTSRFRAPDGMWHAYLTWSRCKVLAGGADGRTLPGLGRVHRGLRDLLAHP